MADVVPAVDNGEVGETNTYLYAFTNKATLSSITRHTVRPHISEPNDIHVIVAISTTNALE